MDEMLNCIAERGRNSMKLIARFAVLTAALALPAALAAATISGTVTDRTTGKPASGDTALLLDLQQGMTESARTTIDAKGHYSFSVSDTAGMHLVRVDHQKASYYGPVPPNTTSVNIDVYDVVPKVDGLHLYADVSRIETDQQGLSVTESWFIRNESKPPRTQLSPRTFEFYLPGNATLEGATATGPGGMAVSSSPVPAGDKGHYAFIFPLRPGETRFQVGYRVPYSGSAKLQARVVMPAENVAIMLPKTMSFDGGNSFQALGADASGPGTQTYLATNVQPNAPVAFTLSGSGSMPREQQNPQGDQGQGAMGMGQGVAGMEGGAGGGGQPGAQDQTPQAGLQSGPGGGVAGAPPIGTPDPLQKYKWWILSGVGLALVIGAAFMLRAGPADLGHIVPSEPSPLTSALPPGVKATEYRAQTLGAARSNGAADGVATHVPGTDPASATAASGSALSSTAAFAAQPAVAQSAPLTQAATPAPMLAALKDELFQLETERLEGRISNAEYSEHKAALEVMLKRALARQTINR